MTNYVIGGIIVALTVYIIYRTVINIKNGKGLCNCSGCKGNCDSHSDCKCSK